jgi:hypothetical protein
MMRVNLNPMMMRVNFNSMMMRVNLNPMMRASANQVTTCRAYKLQILHYSPFLATVLRPGGGTWRNLSSSVINLRPELSPFASGISSY